jgi:RNA 2',3'-cyclic 3'-phosphodiesterase
MRLFTAIELTDEARTAILATQKAVASELAGSSRSLRLVRAEHLHLTLVFIGEVSRETGTTIVDVMSAEIPEAPFRIAFGGVGVFPASGPPRICWLGLAEGESHVIDVHSRVAERVRGCGVSVDSRPFRPHLTLGRWRDRDRQVRARLHPPSERVASVDVTAVTLFESQLSSAGPSYTRLARARLTCP